MAATSIQDRTSEFKSVLALAQRKQNANKLGAQRRSLLTDSQKAAANGDAQPRRSDFARKAAEIGRGISSTMGKLEKLAQCELRTNGAGLPSMLTVYSGQATNAIRRPAG